MIRAVPDNNVWLGAIISSGGAHQLLLRAEAHQFTAVTSTPILHELMGVLRADLACDDDFAYEWWKRLTAACEVIRTSSLLNAIERDPDDNKFIECALDGHCDYIVSQDLDLLDLGSYAGIRIVKIGQFLRLLESSPPATNPPLTSPP